MTATTVPKGYKQTEIGVFPEDWDIKTLGEIGEVTGAGVDKKSNPDEQPVRLVNYVDVYNRRPITSNLLSHWVTAPANKANRCSVRKGDVFFTPTSEVREDIAVSSMALEDIPDAVYSYHLVRLRCSDEVEVAYRAHAFSAKYFLDQASVLADGSGTRYVVNLPNFRRMLVALPPRDEQRRIGTLLTDVETQIAKLSELISKKSAIKKGTMEELLTGKTRLPGFRDEWTVEYLGKMCDTYSGGTPNTSNSSYYGGQIPWITSADLNQEMIEQIDGRITNKGLSNSSAKMVERNSLLYAMYGATAGVAAITKVEAAINQAVLCINTHSINTVFLYYVLRLNKLHFIEKYTQGGQPNFSSSIVKFFEINYPSDKNEQEAIAEVLSDMDAEIEALKANLEKLKSIKQGILQELLTGKIRMVGPELDMR